MARITNKARAKKVMASKPKRKAALTAIQNTMMYGDEPIYKPRDSYRMYILRFYNWINNTFDNDQLKNEFITYAKNNNYNISEIKNLPDYEFASLGKIAYLYNNDRIVDEQLANYFDKKIIELPEVIMNYEQQSTPSVDEDKMSTNDKNILTYQDYYSEIEQLYKETDTEEKIQEIIAKRPNIQVLKMLEEHFQMSVNDWTNELKTFGARDKSKQKTTTENYLKNSEIALKIIKASLTNQENAKAANRKPRKARTPKKIPASKLVEKLNYKKEDKELNLVSINPENIIGAKSLVIFNTKTRKFGYFIATDSNGLTVKGSTIMNFDEQKSPSKTLRKPSEQILALTDSTMKRMEVQFGAIKAVDIKLKGRINQDILLLKIFK